MAKNSVTRTQRSEQRVKYERLREAGRWQPGNFMSDPTGRRGYTPAAGMGKVGVKQMPAPSGEAVVGNRLNKVAAGLKQIGPAFRAVTPKQQVVSNVVSERTTPTPASKTSTRMATNPVTGKTTGFTSGTTTGKTMTKAGVASKTAESAYQRQQRMAAEKSGGSMRSTGGGSSRSTGGSTGGRGGTGPSGMGYSGRGTGGKR